MADKVEVTLTVTIRMTDEQRAAYSDCYGVGFVELELAGRTRQELATALDRADWMEGLGGFTVAEPVMARRPVVLDLTGDRAYVLSEALDRYAAYQRDRARAAGGAFRELRRRQADLADGMRRQAEAAFSGGTEQGDG